MDLQEKFRRFIRLSQTFVHKNHAWSPLSDSSRGQGRVLALLKMQPEITTKDLGYLLGIRPQSLNELLGKLEKNGIITRTPCEDDKRKVMVKLTEKGRNEKQEDVSLDDIFACLTADEQAKLGEYLDRVSAVLEEKAGTSDEHEWFSEARERFGEKFEQLIALHKGGFLNRDDSHHHHGRGGYGENRERGGYCGYGGRGENCERDGYGENCERGGYGENCERGGRGENCERGGRGRHGRHGGRGRHGGFPFGKHSTEEFEKLLELDGAEKFEKLLELGFLDRLGDLDKIKEFVNSGRGEK